MADIHIEGMDQAFLDRQTALNAKLSALFHGDPAFRSRLETDGAAMLRDMGYSLPEGAAVKVVADTPALLHFVFPPSPNTELTDEALSVVAGGSTVGSAGTLGTLSCIIGSVACLASAGTAGTAG